MPPKHTVLVEYFCTDDVTLVFGVRAEWDEPKVVEINMPLADIRRETAKYFGDERDAEGHILQRASTKIRALDESGWQTRFDPFIAPIREWADEGDIVWLVPHDVLHYQPLHALKLEGRYFIERNPIVYSPSASVMKYCQLKRKGRREHALVLGDSRADLPHAREEAHAVATMFGTMPFLRESATKQLVKEKLAAARDDIDVLHFACHGFFDQIQPLRSGIRLAPNGDGNSDLTAEEIFSLEMHAELVVLSSCDSGVNDRKPGDELIGLTRALIYAGTPTVMVSLWSVDDLSTRLMMQTFYDQWLAPREPVVTKAEALQKAQLAVMQISAQEALTRVEQFKNVQGEDIEGRRAILDWDAARIHSMAGNFDRAIALGKDVRARMVPWGDVSVIDADIGGWELVSEFVSEKPDYTRPIYAKPYYWAPFVLVGDWK